MHLPFHSFATAVLGASATFLAPAPQSPAPPVSTPQQKEDAAAPAAQEDPESEVEARPFRIPDHGAAKTRMARADEHIAGARWSEAITELQSLLEDHRGDLLAGEHPLIAGHEPSAQAVYVGAARRARERLLRLPAEARKLYRDRFERDASVALERARASGDRGALAEIARRWPLTRSAESAWWSLGDLELERGESDKAQIAWGRALARFLEVATVDLADGKEAGVLEERLAAPPGEDPNSAEASRRAGIRRRVDFARSQTEANPTPPAASGGRPVAPPVPAATSHETFVDALRSTVDPLRPTVDPPRATGDSLRSPADPLRSSIDPLRPSSGASVASPGGRNFETWPEPFDLPTHPFQMRLSEALFPARAADVVLVSTSLRLFALHAWSGTLLWDSGEPAGWSDIGGDRERQNFFTGIDDAQALIAPAAGGRVALAALQIPVTFVASYLYSSNVPVTTVIPDRRLFAFDLESGRRLWSHEPPPGWDGEGGTFAQRMSVAGPPIVCGGRVLAPFYRLQGRIDYHVGCFDLDTGALLWSTALISGQRELNMFGRPEHEFGAPPVVVVGDRVIALTQLGTIAALDLLTGELLWETPYDQIPLPRNVVPSYRQKPRDTVWENAPPVVTDGVVVATPFDSYDMVGLDLASGAMLWSLGQRSIQDLAGGSNINLLVGARGGTVFLYGRSLAALRAPRGLAASPPDSAAWSFSDEEFQKGAPWRPVLTGDRIQVPLHDLRVEIDAETGRKLAESPWTPADAGGNLVVGPGEVTALSRRRVSTWFDWDVLTDRARGEATAHPGDPSLVLALGRLLADRGMGEWQRGQAAPARAHLDEAESVLARAVSERSQGRGDGEVSPAGAEMHRVLRAKARLRAGLADRAGALAALRKARALAPDAPALRDTLLEELALLRSADVGLHTADVGSASSSGGARDPGYEAALEALEHSCADLPIVCDVAPEDDGARASTAGFPRFVPLVGASVHRDAVPWELPAGLWVLFDRIASAEELADTRAEFAALHAVLERYGSVELPGGTASGIVSDRIGQMLRDGRVEGYATFEARAEKFFEEAASARDPAGLARVGRLFPHSKAAEAADDRRLAWAMESGDASAVAEIVQSVIPRAVPGASGRGWNLTDASEREVRALLRLSSTLGHAGSRDLANAILRRLSAARGEVHSDLDGDGGRTLAELAAGIPRWRSPELDEPIGRFQSLHRDSRTMNGAWEILGRIPPEEDWARCQQRTEPVGTR